MRSSIALALAATLAAGTALAQAPQSRDDWRREAARSGQVPVDHGPFTPEANRAYMGGGVILEGPPGAPAPVPEPTPPGQTPRWAVPLGE